MNEKYKWNLSDIFEKEELRESSIKSIYENLEKIESYKDKLQNNINYIYDVYELYEEALKHYEKVYAYAMLKYHQNMADSENIKLYKEAEKIGTDFSIKTSFIEPEITNIDEKELLEYLEKDEKIKRYKKSIRDILENKKHVLSKEIESILSNFSEVFNISENTFDIFTNTEFEFKDIIDKNGDIKKLTDATYSKYIADKDRSIRIQAFNSMYEQYKKHINTITELYLGRVKENVTISKLRNYSSALEKAVKNDDASKTVYEKLMSVVNKRLDVNHRYIKLKKNMLSLDEMHMYDIYVNPLKTIEENISYEEAQNIILDALKPMGEKYLETIKYAFENRWIDVYAHENKRNGAYSMGVYGVHPFILANFTNKNRDVATIAHELGHTMHSYYANNNQTVLNATYTIMVAEVASTVNEIILGEYLINKEQNKEKKMALINGQLDDIRATLIRQSMFAEFEKIVHETVEDGKQLSSKELCKIYGDLNKKYFGDSVIIDDNIKYEWARIPHFYTPFYVYKYATGISAAISIATKILEKGEEFVQKYIEMLKQGGAKKSIELLKIVDVDLETDEPYEKAFDFFERYLDKLEELC